MRWKNSIKKGLVHAALILGAVITLIPILWMVSTSFMPPGEASAHSPSIWPSNVTTVHYETLFLRMDLARYLFNSLLIAGVVTAVSVLFNTMAGYAFAKLSFWGRDVVFSALLGGLVIPMQVAMLPLFLLMKEFGLINTYAGVILPTSASIFGIFLIRQYALSIPDELLDMARVDGAGEFRIFWSIVVPLCRPVIAALTVITFLAIWNDFLWPLIILTDSSMYTLPVALANLVGERAMDVELVMAGSLLTVLPVIILFIALQRHYIQGLYMGSVKG